VGFRVKSDLRNHQAIVQPRLYEILLDGYADHSESSPFRVTFKYSGRNLVRKNCKIEIHSMIEVSNLNTGPGTGLGRPRRPPAG
jgi:hypothetical protein